jgi:hypothetical protein
MRLAPAPSSIEGIDETELNLAIMKAIAPSRQARRRLEQKGDVELGISPANDNRRQFAPLSSASAAAIQLMKYTGPIGEAFLNDRKLITGIMGPVGSAKTTKCVGKMIKSATWQNRGPDGIYRAKWAVVRDTYPQLKKTVLATWHRWFPKKLGEWNGEAPFEHTLSFLIFIGVHRLEIELTVIFSAIGENKAEDVMRGWEVTGIWLNEGDLVAYEVFAFAITRVGRYPTSGQGGCQWRGVMLDMNAPDIENWTYGVFVEKDLGLTPEAEAKFRAVLGEMFGVGFYVQPGGFDTDAKGKRIAENLENLPDGYYEQQEMALAKRPWLVRRMVHNKFGPVRNGQPVFTEYNDNLHCSIEKLEPIRNVAITICADAGMTPAAVFGQRDHRGQIRVLGEVVVFAASDEEDLQQLGATEFGRMCGRYFLDEFPNNDPNETVYIDPAGTAGERAASADPSWRQNFQKGLREILGARIRVRPAPTKGNRLDERLQAVRTPMLRLVEGGAPGYIIDGVRCRILRRGFKGKYVYARTQLANGHGRFNDVPVKNDESHVQDGNQYLCLALTKHGNGANDNDEHPRFDQPRRKQVTVDSSYNVHRSMRR